MSWRAVLGAGALLSAAACATDAEDPFPRAVEHAQVVREIHLQTPPAVRQITREELTAESQLDANDATDDDYQRQHDTYGRLGFYPAAFDLRSSGGSASNFYIAYYSTETKSVTVVGEPDHSTLVHELVHALQDERFDLQRIRSSHLSSDESLARSALVEGDARMAEYRDLLVDRGQEVNETLNAFVTTAQAYTDADTLFGKTSLPLVFAAHAAFAYGFGSALVAQQLGLRRGSWNYFAVDALFAAAVGPRSTQAVIRADVDVDPIEDTGLGHLSSAVAADWTIEQVDRMGEWYMYVLLYRSTRDRAALATLLHAWDGDQLLTLRKKDGNTPPAASSPSGIVWTTIWDDAASAKRFVDELTGLYRILPSSNPKLSQIDQEPVWLEQRDRQVCLVKNLPAEVAEPLAHAALYTAAERRFEIARPALRKPPLVH